jgi:plastocyanin
MKQDFAWRAGLDGLLGLIAGVAVMAAPTGTTVTWTNNDDTPYVVASSIKAFRSKALDTDDKLSFTFTTVGIYAYCCSLHPHMTGTIVVEEATGRNAVS